MIAAFHELTEIANKAAHDSVAGSVRTVAGDVRDPLPFAARRSRKTP